MHLTCKLLASLFFSFSYICCILLSKLLHSISIYLLVYLFVCLFYILAQFPFPPLLLVLSLYPSVTESTLSLRQDKYIQVGNLNRNGERKKVQSERHYAAAEGDRSLETLRQTTSPHDKT